MKERTLQYSLGLMLMFNALDTIVTHLAISTGATNISAESNPWIRALMDHQGLNFLTPYKIGAAIAIVGISALLLKTRSENSALFFTRGVAIALAIGTIGNMAVLLSR